MQSASYLWLGSIRRAAARWSMGWARGNEGVCGRVRASGRARGAGLVDRSRHGSGRPAEASLRRHCQRPGKGARPDRHARSFAIFLPEVVDLSHYFPVPGDQGNQGSCTGWAVGYAARAYYAAAVEAPADHAAAVDPEPGLHLQPESSAMPGDCGSGSSNMLALEMLKYAARCRSPTIPTIPIRCDVPTSDADRGRHRFQDQGLPAGRFHPARPGEGRTGRRQSGDHPDRARRELSITCGTSPRRSGTPRRCPRTGLATP